MKFDSLIKEGFVKLDKNQVAGEFIQALTPLSFSPKALNEISFYNFNVGIKKAFIENGGLKVSLIYYSDKLIKPELSFYEEGLIVRVFSQYYFLSFESSNLSVVKILKEPYNIDFEYNLSRGRDVKQSYKEILNKNYFYHYKEHLESQESGVYEDTRHYTKSGKLDKRYSKQNRQTGGSYTHSSYSVSEKFLLDKGFGFYANNEYFGIHIKDWETFSSIIGKIYNKVGKEVPSIEGMQTQDGFGAFRELIEVVQLLTVDDRNKINKYLDSRDRMKNFEETRKPQQLFEEILNSRRKELLGH